MKINEIIDNTKLFEALRKSKYFKKLNHKQLKAGRFPDIPRFTKFQNYLLESLYTLNDMHNPSAFRVYLYLLRHVSGYDGRISIEYRKNKIMKHMNMGNNFYRAIKSLEKNNMVHTYEKDGSKYIGLNPYPDTWITDSKDKIMEIIDTECNELLGITDGTPLSSSSSSWSSSSSSSASYPSNVDLAHDQLLAELDNM